MSSVRLTTTSFVVLGLVALCEPATPYDVKQIAETTTADFWTLAHTQLYSECTRLAREGLLDEQQEPAGRRRKLYRVTDAGRAALDAWRSDPEQGSVELRDPGILKLFFGADPAVIAPAQLALHEARLARYREQAETDLPDHVRLALECGIGHEQEYVRYWTRLAQAGGRGPRSSGGGG